MCPSPLVEEPAEPAFLSRWSRSRRSRRLETEWFGAMLS